MKIPPAASPQSRLVGRALRARRRSLGIFAVLIINPEGIDITQPRVARNELPWEVVNQSLSTLKELNQTTGRRGLHHAAITGQIGI